MHAASRHAAAVRVVSHGLDWLEVSVLGLPIRADLLADLARRQEQLRDRDRDRDVPDDGSTPERVDLGGMAWTLHRGGGGSGYTYLLTSEAASVQLWDRADPSEKDPNVHVTFRAGAIHEWGWRECLDSLRTELLPALAPPGYPLVEWTRVTPSRIDPYADVQGWDVTREEVAQLAVTRHGAVSRDDYRGPPALEARWTLSLARLRRSREAAAAPGAAPEEVAEHLAAGVKSLSAAVQALEDERAEHERTDYTAGTIYTGVTFARGSKSISADIYLKTNEIKKSKKHWMRTIWKRDPGYESDSPVWRCEVRLRRDALRDELRIRTVADLLEPGKLTAIWRYLVGDDTAGGWLSFRAVDNPRVSRRTVDPRWRVLQALVFDGADAPALVRAQRASRASTRDRVRARTDAAVASEIAHTLAIEEAERSEQGLPLVPVTSEVLDRRVREVAAELPARVRALLERRAPPSLVARARGYGERLSGGRRDPTDAERAVLATWPEVIDPATWELDRAVYRLRPAYAAVMRSPSPTPPLAPLALAPAS